MTFPSLFAPQYRQGDVWYIDLNPTLGREQQGLRPCLIMSVDFFNLGLADLLLIIPITSKNKNIPLHVEVSPPEGGLTTKSFIMCEAIRSVSKTRLRNQIGSITIQTLMQVKDKLRILMNL